MDGLIIIFYDDTNSKDSNIFFINSQNILNVYLIEIVVGKEKFNRGAFNRG